MVLLIHVMRRVIRYGTVSLIDTSGKRYQITSLGKPEVVLRLTDNAIAKRLVFATSMGWCEAYMDGKLLIKEGTLNDFLEAWGRSEKLLAKSWIGELFRIFYGITAAVEHYNLIASEVAFRVQNITVLQIQLSREIDTLPITRDYMVEAELELAFKDSINADSRPKKKAPRITEEELEVS